MKEITTFNDIILESLRRDQNRSLSFQEVVSVSGAHEWMKFMAEINVNRCKVVQLTSTLNKKLSELHMWARLICLIVVSFCTTRSDDSMLHVNFRVPLFQFPFVIQHFLIAIGFCAETWSDLIYYSFRMTWRSSRKIRFEFFEKFDLKNK